MFHSEPSCIKFTQKNSITSIELRMPFPLWMWTAAGRHLSPHLSCPLIFLERSVLLFLCCWVLPITSTTSRGWDATPLPTHSKHTGRVCGETSLCSLLLSTGMRSFYSPRGLFWKKVVSVELAAAAAKSLQSCPTLCDPIDGSPPGSPVPGTLQTRTLEWVAISFSNAWKWKVKVKLLSRVRLLVTPWTAAHQAPPSMGFSRWSLSPPELLRICHNHHGWGYRWFYLLSYAYSILILVTMFELLLSAKQMPGAGDRTLRNIDTVSNLLGEDRWERWQEPECKVCLDWDAMVCYVWKWKSLSRVWLFATPWTIQSMEFSRPEYWSG